MSTSDKLNIRFTFDNGTNSTMSISDYKADSATNENLQTLANAAANVLETDDSGTFVSITNVTHVVTSETSLAASLNLPITPST